MPTKEYYQEHKDYYKQYTKTDAYKKKQAVWDKRKQLIHTAYLAEIKLSIGCQRCGYKEDACALDFEHIDPSTKKYQLAKMSNFSRQKVKQELEKCIVLCSNCHRIVTLRPEKRKEFYGQLYEQERE